MHFAQTIAAVHFCWLTAHLHVSELSLSLSLSLSFSLSLAFHGNVCIMSVFVADYLYSRAANRTS